MQVAGGQMTQCENTNDFGLDLPKMFPMDYLFSSSLNWTLLASAEPGCRQGASRLLKRLEFAKGAMKRTILLRSPGFGFGGDEKQE